MKLIILTVDTEKNCDYLADAVSVEITLKLRPYVPGETAEMLKIHASGISVMELGDLLGELGSR